MPEVLTEITGMVSQVVDLPGEEISTDSRFDTLPEWSSYAALRLLTGIEQRFGVRLNLREYLSIRDVGGLADAVSLALAGAGT